MTKYNFMQMALYLGVLLALVKPLGYYLAQIYSGHTPGLARVLAPLECALYRMCCVRREEEMDWRTYALALLAFNFVGVVLLYVGQRLQNFLPLNPQNFNAPAPDAAFNTAISFVTNTNWQSYSGETTMSYFTQMLGLTVQNFLSAASGMATLVALVRGLARGSAHTLGNFWSDLVRSTLYIFLPLASVLAILLVHEGVVQNFNPYRTATLLQPTQGQHGEVITTQVLPMGPAASQIAIKQLGTNGGGFFNANAAHPFENPTPLSNFLQLLAILLLPAASCYMFGKMLGDTRQGWAVLATMLLVFVALQLLCLHAEQSGNPGFARSGVDQTARALQAGGNLEGKEVRFGIINSTLWATATTAASNGSVNSMHDSYTPLGGLAPLLLIQFGEVIFGGVGSGLYGMLIFALIAVFVAGLMVGRTPEYLGKKIEAFEMKMAALIILIPPLLVLGGTALALSTAAGRAAIFNNGAHGFSEVLYAFASLGNNNGSAFAGLNANLPFYNFLGGIAMWLARYWLAIPTLAIAGALARKKSIPRGPGTLPTHNALFVALLLGVVVLVGALTFIPALALGPIVEHLLIIS